MEEEKITSERPSWDEYFMLSAAIAATRASCLHLKSGAVIVKDKRIISSGYNGSPPGVPSCYQLGFCRKNNAGVDWSKKGSGHCLATHAEANALVQNHEQSVEGATMYSIYFPCNECAKLIASSGIKEIIFLKYYKEEVENNHKILAESGVNVRPLSINVEKQLKLISDVLKATKQ